MRSSNAVNFGKHCLLLGWVRTCCRSINELFSYLNCNWPMALHKFSAHTPHGSRLRDKTVLSSRLKVKVQLKTKLWGRAKRNMSPWAKCKCKCSSRRFVWYINFNF